MKKTTMLTIGIDASRANREHKTGVEWYAFFLIEELKKILPEDVFVVLYSEVPLQGPLANLPKNWKSKVLCWPPKRFWTQIRLSLEMMVAAPDVLFIPAHVVPLIHPKRTVMTVHDVAALRFPESYNRFEQWYSLWSAKYALKRVFRLIVPSEFTKKEVLSLNRDSSDSASKKIVVVPHGYDQTFGMEQSKDDISRVLQTYKIQQPYMLTVGRLEEKKNTARVIAAFDRVKEHIPNLQLVLVGKPGHGYEKVADCLHRSRYKQDIFELGWVSQEQLPMLLRGASVFVFPSLYEGFGIPVLEAFSTETPVVVSRGNALEEVGDDAVYTVDPASLGEIATAIEEVLTQEVFRNHLIKKGKERAAQFSWKSCALSTAKVLLDRD